MSKLPPAAQRQLEAAEKLQQALFPQTAPEVVPAEPVAEHEAAQPEVQATPQPVQPVVEPEVQAPAQPQKRSDDYWEQRFRSVAGLLDKEVPRLRDDLQTALRAVDTLRAENVELRKPREDAPTARPAVDPKDIEAFGADMIEMVQRQSQQMYAALSGQLNSQLGAMGKRIDDIEASITGVRRSTTETLEQQFFATLTNLVPEWEQINKDTRWLTWLDEMDPLFGAPRQAALDAAHQRMDAKRVADVFKAFKATLPKPTPTPSLSAQVAPNTAQAATRPTAPPAVKMLSASEMVKRYDDYNKGRYRGREAEWARIEAEFNAAMAEGRVVA